MKKTKILFASVLILVLTLVTSSSFINSGTEKNMPEEYTQQLQNIAGEGIEYTFSIEQESTYALSISVTQGDMLFSICATGDNSVVYDETSYEKGSDSTSVSFGPGDYAVIIDTDGVTGRFSLKLTD